jgi:hypothetical protein
MYKEANLILSDGHHPDQIRADVIEALQAGDHFVVILLKEGLDNTYDLETKTSLPMEIFRQVVEVVNSDLKHVYPGMNN